MFVKGNNYKRDYNLCWENKRLKKEGKKKCSNCKEVKFLSEFNSKGKGIASHVCRPCDKLRIAKDKNNILTVFSRYCSRIITSLKNRAKEVNVPFNLNGEYLYKLWQEQDSKCYYTGEQMNPMAKVENKTQGHPDFPSIDRLIPASGYIEGNVRWCKLKVNIMKNNLSKDQFIDRCKLISSRFI